jgi:hypothetical protein
MKPTGKGRGYAGKSRAHAPSDTHPYVRANDAHFKRCPSRLYEPSGVGSYKPTPLQVREPVTDVLRFVPEQFRRPAGPPGRTT